MLLRSAGALGEMVSRLPATMEIEEKNKVSWVDEAEKEGAKR